MIVEWHWKAVAPLRAHCPGGCFFRWVPWVLQEELWWVDEEALELYLDKVVSVSGLDEDEASVVGSRAIPPQLFLL